MNRKDYIRLFNAFPSPSYVNTDTYGYVRIVKMDQSVRNIHGIKYRYYEIDGETRDGCPVTLFRTRVTIGPTYKDVIVK